MRDKINKTELSLSMEKALERSMIHRDYLAHCIRWGYVLKFVKKRGLTIADIGCGSAVLLKALYSNRSKPRLYLGIDIRSKVIERVKALKVNFPVETFITDIRTSKYPLKYSNLFDLVVCFEVIEHFEAKHLPHVLNQIYKILKPGGYLLLSTPNYDGIHQAKNHIHEYREEELGWFLDQKFKIERKHGTFASQKDIKSVLLPAELKLFNKLKDWFLSDIVSIFFASLYPSQSRNILWVCKKE